MERNPKLKSAMFVVEICIGRPMHKELKRILNHVRIVTVGRLIFGICAKSARSNEASQAQNDFSRFEQICTHGPKACVHKPVTGRPVSSSALHDGRKEALLHVRMSALRSSRPFLRYAAVDTMGSKCEFAAICSKDRYGPRAANSTFNHQLSAISPILAPCL